MNQAYPVVLALGCLAGLGWLVTRRASSVQSDGGAFAAGVAAIGLGLAGARIGYVALHLPYFRRHPLEALWLWEGGLSWVGGAIGVLAAIVLFARFRRRNSMLLADALAIPALLVAFAAWAGCGIDRCIYGVPTEQPFAIAGPDLFGTVAPRWPTAAVGMLASGLLAAGFILLQGRRWRPGSMAAAALGGTAVIALALSFTRGDPSLLIAGVRLDTLGAAGLLLLAGGGLASRRFTSR